MNNKVFLFLRGVFTRAWFFYILLGALAVFIFDGKNIQGRMDLRRLNDDRPSFSALVINRDNIAGLSGNDKRRYREYVDLVSSVVLGEPASLILRGVLAENRGDITAAKRDWVRSAATGPFLFWNIHDLAVLELQQGNTQEALLWAQRGLSIAPEKVFQELAASVFYRQMLFGQDPGLLKQGVIAGRERLLLVAVQAAYFSGNKPEALQLSLKVLSNNEVADKEPFLFFAGSSYYAVGAPDKGLECLLQAVALKSRNPLVFSTLADIMRSLGKSGEAERFLNAARSLQGGLGDGMLYRDHFRYSFL